MDKMYERQHLFDYSSYFTLLYTWISLKRLKKGRMLDQQIVARHCKKTSRLCPIHFPFVFSADISATISHQLHRLIPTDKCLEHSGLFNHAIHHHASIHTPVHSRFHGHHVAITPTQNILNMLLLFCDASLADFLST